MKQKPPGYFEVLDKEQKRAERGRVKAIEESALILFNRASKIRLMADGLIGEEKLDENKYREVKEKIDSYLLDARTEFDKILELKK